MQGFEMFLYGTNNRLCGHHHATSGKRPEPAGSPAQRLPRRIYGEGNLAAQPAGRARTPTGPTVAEQEPAAQGKLAIDLDGSWVSSDWYQHRVPQARGRSAAGDG